jgi:hypothetical protein
LRRPQMRRRPKDQGRVKRAERLLSGVGDKERNELIAKTMAKTLLDLLEKYASRTIPLHIAMDVVEEVVSDPIIRRVLKQPLKGLI